MQECYHCGQLNEDYKDYCESCGKELFIQVDHKRDVKMDHLYAHSIAKELLDENTTVFEEEIEEITQELLKETKEKDPFIKDDEKNLFEITEEKRDEQLVEIEEEIKHKLRRNKKLEAGMGLILRNIDIILDDLDGSLIIMGDITTNDKLDNKSVELSAISYDKNKKVLSKNDTIVQVDHGNFESFNIYLDIDLIKTDIIIILPEMIRYDDETPPDEEKNIEIEELEISNKRNNIFIEQLTDIERKIGMTISNTSVLIKSEEDIEIVGEIRIENPDKYHNIKIAATCYDENNQIIGTESTQINTRLFLGFDTLSLKINNINVNEIQRIRLYPTLQ